MKNKMKIFCIILWILFLLCMCGCAKKEPSTVLTEETSKEIVQLQKDIEKSTCENKDVYISKLNSIKIEVKNINEMCKLRYAELKQENGKLKMTIGFLILLLIGLIILKIRKII